MGKRTLQDDGTWLRTLQRDDVELVTGPVTEITADGVTGADGVHRPADVLIWATGFDVNHQLGPIRCTESTASSSARRGATNRMPTWASPFPASRTCSVCMDRAPTP